MCERVARAAAAASSAASTEVNAHASKAETIVSRMKRMRRLRAEGEEATFIVDTEFKRINPLLQMQNSMPSESWPLSPLLEIFHRHQTSQFPCRAVTLA